ncbi:MAG: hypothetical protein AAGD86_12935 [Pseudomonadota bacterium]
MTTTQRLLCLLLPALALTGCITVHDDGKPGEWGATMPIEPPVVAPTSGAI